MPRRRLKLPTCNSSSAASRPTPPRPSRPPLAHAVWKKSKLVDIKASSRVSPYIRFRQDKKLHRQALTLEKMGHGFDTPLFSNADMILDAGSRLAIIGENGAGKTTFLRCLLGQLTPNHGIVKWAENATLGYCPQDSTADFDNDLTLFEWVSQWRKPNHDDQIVRATSAACCSHQTISTRRPKSAPAARKTACCSAS
jgi:ATPase subunit of ABC transporter with duplicated ATPase domains